MRGARQGAFLCAKLHIKLRKSPRQSSGIGAGKDTDNY